MPRSCAFALLALAALGASAFSAYGHKEDPTSNRRALIHPNSSQKLKQDPAAELSTLPIYSFLSADLLVDEGSEWVFPLMQITRHFNPSAAWHLLTSATPERMDSSSATAKLARLRIDVHDLATYSAAGSRAAAYRASAPGGTHWSGFFERFCAIADLAAAQGHERFLALDSDMALFAGADAVFAPYGADIVTPCPHCSQVVVWRLAAIDGFCDAITGFWQRQGPRDAKHVMKDMALTQLKMLNDMHLLYVYLHETSFSKDVLCQNVDDMKGYGTRMQCAHEWVRAMAGLRSYVGNEDCSRTQDILTWRVDDQGRDVPLLAQTGDALPIVHFQGSCKGTVPEFFKTHYASLGPA